MKLTNKIPREKKYYVNVLRKLMIGIVMNKIHIQKPLIKNLPLLNNNGQVIIF